MDFKTLINPKRFNEDVSHKLSAIQNAIPTRGDAVFAEILKGIVDGCVMQSRKGSLSERGFVLESAKGLGLGRGHSSFEKDLSDYLSGLGGRLIDVNNRTINFVPRNQTTEGHRVDPSVSLRTSLMNTSLVVSSLGEMMIVKKDKEGNIVEKTVIGGRDPHYVGLCLSYDS